MKLQGISSQQFGGEWLRMVLFYVEVLNDQSSSCRFSCRKY